MLSGEATNTNSIVFGLTRSGLESTIYRTGGEHANHYTNDAVRTSYGFDPEGRVRYCVRRRLVLTFHVFIFYQYNIEFFVRNIHFNWIVFCKVCVIFFN
jgi:hypothetical protein